MATISTYGTLKTALANHSERSDLTAMLPIFVDYAQQEIGRQLKSNTNLSTANLTLSAETVALPSDFRAMKRIYLDLTPRQALHPTSADDRQGIIQECASQQYPEYYAIEGSSIGFAPTFTATTVVAKMLYWSQPAAMSADSDTNPVLTAWPFLYLYGALSELFRYIEDDNNGDRYEARFRALLDAINLSDAQDALSGPLIARPAISGII